MLLLPLAAISPPSLNSYPPIYMVSFLLNRTDSDDSLLVIDIGNVIF